LRAVNAFVPIIVLILALAVSMYVTGEGDTITDIVGSSDPYKAMMWASFVGALVAAGLSMGQRILSAHETVDAWYGGARATLFGMIVLILAWSMFRFSAMLCLRRWSRPSCLYWRRSQRSRPAPVGAPWEFWFRWSCHSPGQS